MGARRVHNSTIRTKGALPMAVYITDIDDKDNSDVIIGSNFKEAKTILKLILMVNYI